MDYQTRTVVDSRIRGKHILWRVEILTVEHDTYMVMHGQDVVWDKCKLGVWVFKEAGHKEEERIGGKKEVQNRVTEILLIKLVII